jgi:hypothetical protein
MAKFLTVLLLLAIFAGLILLAVAGWRRRMREQGVRFGAPAESLEGFEAKETATAQYVATTIAGEPLNRVTAYGLGFRGKAEVLVADSGLLISRRGERPLAIAAGQISNFEFAQAVIDRGVEKDGLVAINWLQDQTELTTVLRFNSAADRNRILQGSSALIRKAI